MVYSFDRASHLFEALTRVCNPNVSPEEPVCYVRIKCRNCRRAAVALFDVALMKRPPSVDRAFPFIPFRSICSSSSHVIICFLVTLTRLSAGPARSHPFRISPLPR